MQIRYKSESESKSLLLLSFPPPTLPIINGFYDNQLLFSQNYRVRIEFDKKIMTIIWGVESRVHRV